MGIGIGMAKLDVDKFGIREEPINHERTDVIGELMDDIFGSIEEDRPMVFGTIQGVMCFDDFINGIDSGINCFKVGHDLYPFCGGKRKEHKFDSLPK